MRSNRYQDHLLILPEDDANRQIANGFLLEADDGKIQVLPEAGGWYSVCETFKADHISDMRKYDLRRIILLLDFDNDEGRAAKVFELVPQELRGRVFLLGARTEPEELKRAGLGSYEEIGRKLARECRSGENRIWDDNLLSQNKEELVRLKTSVCGFIF